MGNQAVESLNVLLLEVSQLPHLLLKYVLVIAAYQRVERGLEVLEVFSAIVLIRLNSFNQIVEGIPHIPFELVKLALVVLRQLCFELLVDVPGVSVLLFLHNKYENA